MSAVHHRRGDLVAVLLPGLHGTGKLFAPLLGSKPARFRTLVIEYPTDRVLNYADLVPFVREKLPADDPFVIVAESFAGPIAVSIASSTIDNLQGIVLAASFVTPPGLPMWRFLPWEMLFRLPVSIQLLRRLLTASSSELLHDFQASIKDVAPHVLAARVRATLTVDARDKLKKVTCPLLYIQARRDRVVSRRCLQDILSVRGDVTVESIDTLHPVLQHEPAAAWAIIDKFCGMLVDPEGRIDGS